MSKGTLGENDPPKRARATVTTPSPVHGTHPIPQDFTTNHRANDIGDNRRIDDARNGRAGAFESRSSCGDCSVRGVGDARKPVPQQPSPLHTCLGPGTSKQPRMGWRLDSPESRLSDTPPRRKSAPKRPGGWEFVRVMTPSLMTLESVNHASLIASQPRVVNF